MATEPKAPEKVWFRDKGPMIKIMEEVDAQAGVVYDPTATPEKIREMMRAQGIRPEDNVFSREIIRARYPDKESRSKQ